MAPSTSSSLHTPPQRKRPLRASELLAQFGSIRSQSSATRARLSESHITPGPVTRSAPQTETKSILSIEIAKATAIPRRSSSRLSQAQTYVEITEQDDTDSEDELASEPRSVETQKLQPRRSLRRANPLQRLITLDPHKSSAPPTRAKARKILTSDTYTPSSRVRRKPPPPPNLDTARNRIRDEITMNTAAKRDAFFLQFQEYFLPLLPQVNYISKLAKAMGEDSEVDTVAYEELTLQPAGITATMKTHQLSGLSFLVYLHRNGMNGILGDEMGLGKTLQTISLMQHLKEEGHNNQEEHRPYLVLCPLSVLSSWITEVQRWAPELKVLRFHGGSQERSQLKRVATGLNDWYGNELAKSRKARKLAGEQSGNYDVVVTTYETFAAEASWFKSAFVWRYVILDEGHKIKNNKTNVSSALQGLRAECRLILTGTPLQNNLTELWALLHWLYPTVFIEKTGEMFQKAFDLTHGKADTSFMNHAKRLLELIMLRRLKSSPGVNLGLPPKEEVLLYVPLSPVQRFWYMRLLTKAGDALLEDVFLNVREDEKDTLKKERIESAQLAKAESLLATEGSSAWTESKQLMELALREEQEQEEKVTKKSAWTKLMNLVMQLRKCCSHPYQLPNAAPENYLIGEHVILASGKFIVLRKLLEHIILTKREKVLIFSGFTGVLNCTEDLLHWIGGNGDVFKYLRLDGSTVRARRTLNIRLFNDNDSAYKVMLISTRAGGLGINLATATNVIFLDNDWNPQQDVQAEARAHRIGQTKPVTVYKLVTQGTVEEQMLGRIRKKLYLSAKITESMQNINQAQISGKGSTTTADEDMPHLTTSELKSLLRRGARTLTHPEIDVNEVLSWDINTLLEKCRDKPSDPTMSEAVPTNDNEDEEKWLSQMEKVQAAVFDGKQHHRKTQRYEEEHILPPEITREDRRRGKNTTVLIDGYEVNKESLQCAEWEAVPTLAGKDPRLAELKREKRPEIIHESTCHVCWDGGDIYLCNNCPRSYHKDCLSKEAFKLLNKMGGSCPQHQCVDCHKKSSTAGGMIFRCRWCTNGFCEDCIDWDNTKLIGDALPEFEMLSFGPVTQAFYVTCSECIQRCDEDDAYRDFLEIHEVKVKEEHDNFLAQSPIHSDSTALGLPALITPASDTTTVADSNLPTPQPVSSNFEQETRKRAAIDLEMVDDALSSPEKRRKLFSGYSIFRS